MKLLRHRDRIAGPWANGGGITYEVLRSPADAAEFDWRLSVAEVSAEGPFSIFPDIDRTLVLLSGSMKVVIDDVVMDVERFVPLAFAGESAGRALLQNGPTMDLNIMVRRGRTRVDLRLLSDAHLGLAPAAGADTVVFVLEGEWEANGEQLSPWDCVVVEAPLQFHGQGRLAHLQFTSAQ